MYIYIYIILANNNILYFPSGDWGPRKPELPMSASAQRLTPGPPTKSFPTKSP